MASSWQLLVAVIAGTWALAVGLVFGRLSWRLGGTIELVSY